MNHDPMKRRHFITTTLAASLAPCAGAKTDTPPPPILREDRWRSAGTTVGFEAGPLDIDSPGRMRSQIRRWIRDEAALREADMFRVRAEHERTWDTWRFSMSWDPRRRPVPVDTFVLEDFPDDPHGITLASACAISSVLGKTRGRAVEFRDREGGIIHLYRIRRGFWGEES